MIYKKYIFGHSDNQNIFLICIWFSSSPWLTLLKPLEFPKCVESDKGVFCYVNKMTFGKQLRMPAGFQVILGLIRRLELSVPAPDLWREAVC